MPDPRKGRGLAAPQSMAGSVAYGATEKRGDGHTRGTRGARDNRAGRSLAASQRHCERCRLRRHRTAGARAAAGRPDAEPRGAAAGFRAGCQRWSAAPVAGWELSGQVGQI